MLNIRSQVFGKGREQNFSITFIKMIGQPLGPVHGNHRLTCTSPTQYPNRAILFTLCQATLGRMQENAPFLNGLIKHFLQSLLVLRDREQSTRFGACQCSSEVFGIHRFRCCWNHFVPGFLETGSGHQHEQTIMSILGYLLVNQGRFQICLNFHATNHR